MCCKKEWHPLAFVTFQENLLLYSVATNLTSHVKDLTLDLQFELWLGDTHYGHVEEKWYFITFNLFSGNNLTSRQWKSYERCKWHLRDIYVNYVGVCMEYKHMMINILNWILNIKWLLQKALFWSNLRSLVYYYYQLKSKTTYHIYVIAMILTFKFK